MAEHWMLDSDIRKAMEGNNLHQAFDEVGNLESSLHPLASMVLGPDLRDTNFCGSGQDVACLRACVWVARAGVCVCASDTER
jgi:hypothetical protein